MVRVVRDGRDVGDVRNVGNVEEVNCTVKVQRFVQGREQQFCFLLAGTKKTENGKILISQP
jgi:hypothetical protein